MHGICAGHSKTALLFLESVPHSSEVVYLLNWATVI